MRAQDAPLPVPVTLVNPIPTLTATTTRVIQEILTEAEEQNISVPERFEIVAIALCESGYNQLRPHPNIEASTSRLMSTDYGVMQINDKYHGEEMQKVKLDYQHSEIENIRGGIMIYKKSGNGPWSASRSCWNKPEPGW